jgi:hypothetical protein
MKEFIYNSNDKLNAIEICDKMIIFLCLFLLFDILKSC